MAWLKIESSVARHRKFIEAGPSASWLWVCGLAYAQEGLTDGFIPVESVEYLGIKKPWPLVAKLVKAKLWDETAGGWIIHDYLLHNRDAASVRAIQVERRRAGSAGGHASGESRRKTDAKQIAEASAEATPEASAKQTANPALTALTATATATDQRVAPAPVRMAPIHSNEHRNHAHCGRVCLHSSLFSEFVRRRNHEDADREVRDWAMVVEREWSVGSNAKTEPGEAFAFWKARYAERWPVQASAEDATSKWESGLPQWAQKARAAVKAEKAAKAGQV